MFRLCKYHSLIALWWSQQRGPFLTLIPRTLPLCPLCLCLSQDKLVWTSQWNIILKPAHSLRWFWTKGQSDFLGEPHVCFHVLKQGLVEWWMVKALPLKARLTLGDYALGLLPRMMFTLQASRQDWLSGSVAMKEIQTEAPMDLFPSKAPQAGITGAVLLSLGFGCETCSCHIFNQMPV